MLNRGSRDFESSSTREMSWMPYLHSRMIRLIFRIRSSPPSSISSAHRGKKPQSKTANTVARKSFR